VVGRGEEVLRRQSPELLTEVVKVSTGTIAEVIIIILTL
jgi:hypothetical protein